MTMLLAKVERNLLATVAHEWGGFEEPNAVTAGVTAGNTMKTTDDRSALNVVRTDQMTKLNKGRAREP